MLKKIVFFLAVVAAAWAQFAYQSEWQSAMSKPLLGYADYQVFTNEFRYVAIFAGLALLLAAALFSEKEAAESADVKFWRVGFFGFLCSLVIIGVSINPNGNFPWNKREYYIEIETRSTKIDLYRKLPSAPDILILGSSVSFLMPANYFEEEWSMSAFNLSTNASGPADFVNLLKIIQQEKPNEAMPAVVLAGILNPKLSNTSIYRAPLEQMPSMELNEQFSVLQESAKEALRAKHFSNAMFTLFIVDQERWGRIATLQNDGTMILAQSEMTDLEYRRQVKNNINTLDAIQSCSDLGEGGKRKIEELVELSREHTFSLVFYRAPINEDFYKYSRHKKAEYAACSNLLNKFMKQIVDKNENVIYRDYSSYQKITAGGKDFFRDTHHLTSQGNLMLLKALRRDIEMAIQWAQENR